MAYFKEWGRALRPYLLRTVLTGAIPGVLSIISAVMGTALGLPWWGWLNLVGLAIFVACFYAWRDVARERDKASAERDRLLDGVQFCFNLERVNLALVPAKGIVQVTLVFSSGALVPIRYEIVNLAVAVQSRTALPTFGSKAGYIMPGRETLFRYPVIEEVDLTVDELSGTVDGTARYRHANAASSREFEYVFKVEFFAQGPNVAWSYREPEVHRPVTPRINATP